MIVLIIVFAALIGSVIAISILTSEDEEIYEVEEREKEFYGNDDE